MSTQPSTNSIVNSRTRTAVGDVACAIVMLTLFASQAAAVEYSGYLTVNDEDYGYWQGQPMVFIKGERVPLQALEGPISGPVEFELSHDLVQGLVRQYVARPADSAVGLSEAVSEAAADISAAAPTQRPNGQPAWVRFGAFQTFGFGQYEGSDPTYGVYCSRNPSVWVWSGDADMTERSPDDAANAVLNNENGMAKIRFECATGMDVSR